MFGLDFLLAKLIKKVQVKGRICGMVCVVVEVYALRLLVNVLCKSELQDD